MALDRARIAGALRLAPFATDVAHHLVRRGLPFRDPHRAVGAMVRAAEATGRALDRLALDDMRAVHPAFADDVFAVFDAAASTESRAVRGGTSAAAPEAQFEALAGAFGRGRPSGSGA